MNNTSVGNSGIDSNGNHISYDSDITTDIPQMATSEETTNESSTHRQFPGSTSTPEVEEVEERDDQDSIPSELPESVLFAVPRDTHRFYSMIEIIIVALLALVVGVILRFLCRVFGFSSIFLLGPWRLPLPIENEVYNDDDVAAAGMAQLAGGVDMAMVLGGMVPIG